MLSAFLQAKRKKRWSAFSKPNKKSYESTGTVDIIPGKTERKCFQNLDDNPTQAFVPNPHEQGEIHVD